MWPTIWNYCVHAACSAFNVSRVWGTVFVAALFTLVRAMIAATWFVWAGILLVVLTFLVIAIPIEQLLRVRHRLCEGDYPRRCAVSSMSTERSIPDQLEIRCADSQGRLAKTELGGHDMDTIAVEILRTATIRETWSRRPSWLHFPALCRAIPTLARIGRMVGMMLTE